MLYGYPRYNDLSMLMSFMVIQFVFECSNKITSIGHFVLFLSASRSFCTITSLSFT